MLTLPVERARALAVFFAGGGLLCLSALGLPQGPHTHAGGIIAVGAVALAAAGGLHWLAERTPAWLFHMMVLAGNVLITLVVLLAGPGVPAANWAVMYVWSPVFTAAFCSRAEFAAHFSSTVVLHTLALLALGEQATVVPRVLMVTVTALVVSSVIGSLVGQIRRTAGTDPLTGLPNRRQFEQVLDREHALAERRGHVLAVAVLDLDRFKELNDQYGHAYGDQVLRRAADAWQARLRRGDVLARIGGDEFGLVLPDCSVEDAGRLGEQLVAATPDEVGATVGVTVVGPDETATEALAAADAALYVRKRGGGGSVGVRPAVSP